MTNISHNYPIEGMLPISERRLNTDTRFIEGDEEFNRRELKECINADF